MHTEEWRRIVDHPYYEISSVGRVRSSKGLVSVRQHAGANTKRYLVFNVRTNKKRYLLFCHVEVARAFIGPKPAGMWVLHKDDNETNASVDNLIYGTIYDNSVMALRNKGKPKPFDPNKLLRPKPSYSNMSFLQKLRHDSK